MPLVDPSNFQETQSADDTPVLPGDYKVKIESIDMKDGSAAPYYFVRVRIMEGAFKNRILVDNVSTSEKARWKWSDFVHVRGMYIRVGHEKNPRPGDEDRVRILRWVWKKEVPPTPEESVSDDEIPF